MSYLSQSSRLTFLLIQLKGKDLITPDQYSRLCDHAAKDNPQLKELLVNYENGLSQSELIDELSKMLNNQDGNENIVKSYFDSIVCICKQLKNKIKEFYRDIKQDINEIYKECFIAQHHQQEVKDLIRLILKQFYIKEFSLLQFKQDHQCHILSNNFESTIIKEAQEIQEFIDSQPHQQLLETPADYLSLLKTENCLSIVQYLIMISFSYPLLKK